MLRPNWERDSITSKNLSITTYNCYLSTKHDIFFSLALHCTQQTCAVKSPHQPTSDFFQWSWKHVVVISAPNKDGKLAVWYTRAGTGTQQFQGRNKDLQRGAVYTSKAGHKQFINTLHFGWVMIQVLPFFSSPLAMHDRPFSLRFALWR